MTTRNPLRTAIREQANAGPRLPVRAGGLCGPRRVLQPGFQSNGKPHPRHPPSPSCYHYPNRDSTPRTRVTASAPPKGPPMPTAEQLLGLAAVHQLISSLEQATPDLPLTALRECAATLAPKAFRERVDTTRDALLADLAHLNKATSAT